MTSSTNKSSRRSPVGGVALSLTFLFLGIILASVYLMNSEKTRLQDKEFLQKRLTQLEKAGNAQKARPAGPQTLIRVDEARSGEIPAIRTFEGNLVEIKNTTISSEVSGLVLDIPVEVGDFVKAGETIIVKIDDTWTKFTHDTAIQDIELKTLIMNFEKTEMNRLRPLVDDRAISISEYLAQVNKTDQIRLNLEISKIVRDESAEKLKRTEIMAPFDGHVIAKMTERGSLLSPGNPIVRIISAGEIDAIIHVPQAVVNRIKIGDEIPVDIQSINSSVVGKVHRIVPYAPKDGARMFPIFVRLPNENERLMSGMAVTGRIPSSDPKEGFIVPIEALMDKPDGRTVWVATVQPGEGDQPKRTTVQPVPVKLLAHAVDSCSVEAETDEGRKLLVDKALVVIEGAERLTPGQTVEIQEVEARFFENLPTGSGHSVVD